MAAPRQGVAPPDPREGEALPATAWTASSGPPPFMPTRKKGARPLDANGVRVARSAAAGGPVAAMRYVPPHHGGPLRALISRYSRPQGAPGNRTGRDPDAAGIAWGAPRRLSAWGYRKPKAAQATRRSAGWPKFGGRVRPPRGGLIFLSTSSRSEDVRRGEPPFSYENARFNGSEVDP